MKKRISSVCLLFCLVLLLLAGCGAPKEDASAPLEIPGLSFLERVPLSYAEQFTIDRYDGGYSLIRTMDGRRFCLVPAGKDAPENLDPSVTVLRQPVDHIYLAATSAMGLFAELGSGSAVRFSGTTASDWYIPYAKKAMETGKMRYAGKYREPDYELLLTEKCRLAVESTMIDHSPEVREKLEELGIPVFIDYSSYESHPLGRSEWIKVYGEMTGTATRAEKLFQEQAALLEQVSGGEMTGKTAAFFYLNAAGQAVTRRAGDYITKMIELAGGEPVFTGTGDPESAASVMTMEMEQFYRQAKDADVLLYNSTIDGQVETLGELVKKNPLLAEFRAVKTGNVWCTRQNLFQETMKLGTVIADFHSIFSGTTEQSPPAFLFRLKSGADG